jgi:hypothetical protein
VAGILLIANAMFFLFYSNDRNPNFTANWIAFMPELEASQLKDPINLLRDSHGADPRYPELYGWETGPVYLKFSEWAAECDVRGYLVDHYVGPQKEGFPYQMPDRFYTTALNSKQVDCLRRSIPKGYVLAQLKRPMSPSQIGWDGNGALAHLANGKNNAQTH